MSKPIYIRLSRKKNFNLQKLSLAFNGLPAVNCARPGRWGNMFIVNPAVKPGSKSGCVYFTVPTVEDAVECYRQVLEGDQKMKAHAVAELGDKNLCCWCKPGEPCHVQDVLLKIANPTD